MPSTVRWHSLEEAAGRLEEGMNRTQTKDDARVTLADVRADEETVVIDFGVQDLKDRRRDGGKLAALLPVLATGHPEELPPYCGRLTDEAGAFFSLAEARMEEAGLDEGPEAIRTPKANRAVFSPPRNLEPGSTRRLRFEISLEEIPISSSREEAEAGVRVEPKPPIGPFVFDFEVPVRGVPVVEIGQEAEASGIVMTLERVVNSLVKPQAIVRFDPPTTDACGCRVSRRTGCRSTRPLLPDSGRAAAGR